MKQRCVGGPVGNRGSKSVQSGEKTGPWDIARSMGSQDSSQIPEKLAQKKKL